jgi:hypothetical protein
VQNICVKFYLRSIVTRKMYSVNKQCRLSTSPPPPTYYTMCKTLLVRNSKRSQPIALVEWSVHYACHAGLVGLVSDTGVSRNCTVSSSGGKSFILKELFTATYESNTFLRTVGNHSPNDTMSRLRNRSSQLHHCENFIIRTRCCWCSI